MLIVAISLVLCSLIVENSISSEARPMGGTSRSKSSDNGSDVLTGLVPSSDAYLMAE